MDFLKCSNFERVCFFFLLRPYDKGFKVYKGIKLLLVESLTSAAERMFKKNK